MKTAGIYIHFPFCENKCIYCDYYSIEKRGNNIGVFVEMLQREIELSAKDHEEDWIFNTIYFGGGSPALLFYPRCPRLRCPRNHAGYQPV